jgi:hypothetical protein
MEVFMSKLRIMLVSIFAVFALAAVASASASAAECAASTKGGCIEESKALVESISVTGSKEAETASELEVTGIGKIVCTTASNSGALDSSASSGVLVLPFIITFTGCVLNAHPTCTVLTTGGTTTGTVATKEIEGSVTAKSGTSGIVAFKSTGTLFAEVEIAGCEQAAKIKVSGTQECKFLLMETESTEHLLACATTESKLKNGEKTAFFSLTEVIKTTNPAKGSLELF